MLQKKRNLTGDCLFNDNKLTRLEIMLVLSVYTTGFVLFAYALAKSLEFFLVLMHLI